MSNIYVTPTEEGIYQLKIVAPENGNRLSQELCAEFLTALASLTGEPSLKVLILTGGKDVFCAGATLEMLKQISIGSADVKDLLLPEKILSFPAPVIGALEGHAVGGGLTLALCCDILVASESSRYGVNFTNMGFTPGMGTTSLLPVLAGHHFASEMILTGKLYKGRELRERGLFNYVVPREEVMEVALDIARRIAEKPRHVLEMLKNTLSLPRRQALQEAMFREHLMHKICFSRPDTAAHIEAAYLA
jgi:polyketide biosynthesis enoyl-CoA hydratase PksI